MTIRAPHSSPLVSASAPRPTPAAAGTGPSPLAAGQFPVRLDGWWSLLYHGWTLLTPQGTRLDLTEVERAAITALIGGIGDFNRAAGV